MVIHQGDLAPTLIALDAKIKLASSKGNRVMPLEEFYTGLFETAKNEDELVVEVQVPPVPARTATAYTKFNLIENDQGIVGVAATVDGRPRAVSARTRGSCSAMRGSPRSGRRMRNRFSSAKILVMPLLAEAGEAAASDADPVSDIHASEEHRRHLVDVLTKRMVKQAWEQAAKLRVKEVPTTWKSSD